MPRWLGLRSTSEGSTPAGWTQAPQHKNSLALVRGGCLELLHCRAVTCNMMGMEKDKSVRERVSTHRARLRAQGMRPIQIWVPDVRSPEFAVEAHRQSVAVASSAQAGEDQAFIEAVSGDQ